jgi:hypothetical protein
MNLLRYYFKVGGETFDVEGFSLAAIKNGFEGGRSHFINNTKKLTRWPTGETREVKILSGISGTSGAGFATWGTALVEYATDRDVYLQDLGMTSEHAQVWLREEEALVKFLRLVKDRLPRVQDFCTGECFSLLILIYGYDEADDPGGGQHYSEVLMRSLCELNAGISTDSEPFELHFERLRGLGVNC